MPPRIAQRALARVACLALIAFGSAQAEPAPAFDRLASVRVDVQPMVEQGGGPQAEALREDLLAALRTSFADRLVGGRGPSLVVVVRSLSMRPYVGGEGRLAGGMQSDYLDGEALLVAGNGAVLARHPQLSALPASYGGAWYDPQSERRRVTAIAEHYAQWLSRALPVR